MRQTLRKGMLGEGNQMLTEQGKPQRDESSLNPRGLQAALCIAAALFLPPPLVLANSPAARESPSLRLVHSDTKAVMPQLRPLPGREGVHAEWLIEKSQHRMVGRGLEAAHQFAGQRIGMLGKTPSDRELALAASDPGEVVGYSVAPDRIDAVAETLRQKFPQSAGVRIAPDRRTSQLVVIASPDMHVEIARYLQVQGEVPSVTRTAPEASGSSGGVSRYRLQNISTQEFEASLKRLWGNALVMTADTSGKTTTVSLGSDPSRQSLMRIDRTTREILFTGTGEASRSWRQVAAALDRTPSSQGATTQLVPVRRADPAQVQQAINMIRDAALRTAPGETLAAVPVSQPGQPRSGVNLVSMIFQQAPDSPPATPPAQAPAQTPGGASPPAAQDQPGEAADGEQVGLLGDVQIEFVPELGVIILRGNRRDVERVQRIIDEIETQSEVTRPEIEVKMLEHTNSEAMAALVTQIYSDVYQPRQGSLSITALVKPNAILLVGRVENITTASELIQKLDQPVAPETQIKVFRLLNMSAVNAETYLRNFYGAAAPTTPGVAQQAQQTGRGLSPRVTVIGDYRSNSLIVQASPRDLAEVANLLEELDVDKTDANAEVRIFPLKNSVASTMQSVLQATLTAQAQGVAGLQPGLQPGLQQTQGQTENPVSRSIQIIGIDQEGNKLIESGLLTDVTITADDNSNSLVVKAPTHSMGLIAALIEQLDRIPAAESQIKVFQIKNGDATNLTTMLQTLFGQQVTAGQVGVFSQTVGRTFGAQTPLQQASAGESSLIPLNFGVDARTNSILASGAAADLAVVEAILLRLDEGDLRQRKLIVYRLNNAPAQFVADALTQILNEQYQLLSQQQSQQFSLISQFELIDQQISVVPEIISNTLIVSATPKYYEQITEVIQDLDRRPPMIMIQVVVCLVRLDDNEELGVELGIQDSLLFDRSATAGGLLDPGFNFINRQLGNADTPESLATRGSLAGQAFGSFAVGRSSATEGFPGLVLSAANESINILIRALARKSRVEVLSRPQIMTLNNVPASVLVGQRIPQISNFQTTSAGNTVNSVELVDVGVSLGVIPRVTPDGLIIMDLEANDSKAGNPADGITVGVQDGIPIQSPIYDDITAITTIAARSGQTVVFGGLISSERSETFRGVPFLSEIPVLGHLFRFDTKADSRSELIFFLTPHIVMDDEDIETLNQREADRMSWCLADVVQVHGDPGFGIAASDTWGAGTPMIYPSLDPTAAGMLPFEGAEPVPAPTGETILKYGPIGDPGKPFILPPDQRQEGKPFILPPDQRQEGKPFILPPAEQTEGQPFITPPAEQLKAQPLDGASSSQGNNHEVRMDLQPIVGWHGPELPAVSPAEVMPRGQHPAPVVTTRSPEPGVYGPPAGLPGVPPQSARTPSAPTTYVPRPASQFPYVK
ncbi:MAG: type II secretion system protein GspD [Pirellulaceae bacterium]